MHIDLPRVEGDGERLLGTVTVTDGQFSLYTRRTDAISGTTGTSHGAGYGWRLDEDKVAAWGEGSS